ncbi:hypothetical protein [Streptomyces sp. NPDC048057]|uniref:hypothetical protein n=1 Tax=Streptomyces sp. NPDC048057 TaxID=3155628 RepID=UPI0033F8E676
MSQPRHTADTITDDALDHLYRQLATLHRRTEDDADTIRHWQGRAETAEVRAEKAEAAIDRVRTALARLCDDVPHPGHDHLCPDDIQRAIEDALDEQPAT